jgi:hypothetical protein
MLYCCTVWDNIVDTILLLQHTGCHVLLYDFGVN